MRHYLLFKNMCMWLMLNGESIKNMCMWVMLNEESSNDGLNSLIHDETLLCTAVMPSFTALVTCTESFVFTSGSS